MKEDHDNNLKIKLLLKIIIYTNTGINKRITAGFTVTKERFLMESH